VAEKSKQDVKQEVEQRLRVIELSTYLIPRATYIGNSVLWGSNRMSWGPDPHRRAVLHRAPEGTAPKLAASPYPTPRCLHEM